MGPNYLKIAGLSLLAIRLVVFVRRQHWNKVTNVEKASEATGIGILSHTHTHNTHNARTHYTSKSTLFVGNVIGNKGGVGISFHFYETRLCFVNSHLAARIDETRNKQRFQNYRDIVKGLKLAQ